MSTNKPPDSSKRKKGWVDAAGSAGRETSDTTHGIRWQWVVGGLIAVALVILIAQNSDKTQIDFLFFDFSSHLWLILLLAAVAGAIAWEAIKHAVARRRRQSTPSS
jgi:uncharacterized integral membrane protein